MKHVLAIIRVTATLLRPLYMGLATAPTVLLFLIRSTGPLVPSKQDLHPTTQGPPDSRTTQHGAFLMSCDPHARKSGHPSGGETLEGNLGCVPTNG